MSFFREKHIFNPIPEQRCDFKGKGKAGIVLAGLDRIYRLPRDIELISELGLRPLMVSTQVAHAVLHLYLALAIDTEKPQMDIMKEKRIHQGMTGIAVPSKNPQTTVAKMVAARV